MSEYLLAFATAILGWWICTGVILFLNHLPKHTYRWSFLAATGLLVVSLALLPAVSAQATKGAAIVGFGLALVIWGWLEMGYLMGLVTGPHSAPCPPQADSGKRFRLGVATSLYHEIAVLVLAASVVALTWGAPNQVATMTFITLWLMRWSAKLNLFLGVRNYNWDWLPEHLGYLDSYTRRRRMNALFPVSVAAGLVVTIVLFRAALNGSNAFEVVSSSLVGTLVALAVLEHCFLVLPLRDAALWQWAVPAKPGRGHLAPVHPDE